MKSKRTPLKALILVCCMMHSCSGGGDKTEKIDHLIHTYFETDLFNGVVLVAERDKIIYHHAFGLADREWETPNTKDTRFRIASLSKPFTALLVMQLYEEGKIGLNDVITDYIKDYKSKWGDSITIHQLLTHTSGIITSLPPELEKIQERLYHSLRDMVSYTESSEICFSPGKGYRYSNFGYNILAYIIEKVTGKSHDTVLQERICKPAGLSGTCQALDNHIEKKLAKGYEYKLLSGFENASGFDESYTVGSGGLISSAEDLFLFDKAIYSGKLVKEETLAKIFKPYSSGNYGYGWFINMVPVTMGTDTLMIAEHSGSINGYGAYIARIMNDSKLVIVLKNQRSDTFIDPAYAPDIGKQIMEILYGGNVEMPKPSIARRLGYIIGTEGTNAAISDYNQIIRNEPDRYNLMESELNKLGIELLFRYRMTDAALKIFEINMIRFPRSYNTYDSYAYALKETGDYKESISYYRKGFEVLRKYPSENISESVKQDSLNAAIYIKEMENELNQQIPERMK